MSNILKPALKKIIPKSQRDWLRQKLTNRSIGNDTYEDLYETYARQNTTDHVIGDGDFDLMGTIERDLLLMEGLKPRDTLVDLGCGVGRLAVKIIPMLAGGRYIGIDISDTMLQRADKRIREDIPEPPCHIEWVKQITPQFRIEDKSVDMICAFSVFTHMEHEDTYKYLKEALRIVRPGGRFIFSCTDLRSKMGRAMFLNSAALDLRDRWSYVRNVTTSLDYITEVVNLSGWSLLRSYDGETANIGPPGGEMLALGQTSCILEAPA
jgi:ubiquinone/menaquinone biosynthesis C-methylase UbiE